MEQPQQRDIVYCHQCENEWYRDEGGLTCPDCQSDFTEIVEGGNDPRAQGDDHDLPGAENSTLQRMLDTSNNHPLQDHDPWNAPDPDEDDIDHFQWERAAQPGQFHASFNRTYNLDGRGQAPGQGAGAGAGGGGLLGMIGNMVGGLLQQPQQGQQQPGQGQEHEHDHTRGRSQEEGRDAHASTPGSPNAGEQQEQSGRPGTFTRHVHGPGYSFTMTATTASNLSPRNANNPQPFNAQPQDMDDLMQQMFNNIGGFPPLMPGQDPRQNQQPRGPGGNPVFPATVLQLLNNLAIPGNGVQGDAVYSQEALDRIVSQLMETHQTGNAPGPASEAAIRSLPTRAITEEDAGDSGTADCSICMDTVPTGGTVTVLPCSHWFHADCIHAWLGEHDTCPVCRKGIMPRDSTAESEGARASGQAPLNDHSTAAAVATATPNAPSAGGGNSNSAGVFSRMRDAFGGGSGGGNGGGGGAPGGGDSST
jgi:E3 ubiquitin-protein ligase RNF115/126